jgi:hypothetical protein
MTKLTLVTHGIKVTLFAVFAQFPFPPGKAFKVEGVVAVQLTVEKVARSGEGS